MEFPVSKAAQLLRGAPDMRADCLVVELHFFDRHLMLTDIMLPRSHLGKYVPQYGLQLKIPTCACWVVYKAVSPSASEIRNHS